MTPQDQEKLYAATKKCFSHWDFKQVSGYVHGVVDGLRHDEPRQIYVHEFEIDEPYALGYIYGFIDAQGEDAFLTDWGKKLFSVKENVKYRWWEQCGINVNV